MRYAHRNYIASLLLFGLNGIVASQIALSSDQIVLLRTFLGSGFLLLLFVLTRGDWRVYRQKKDVLFVCLSGIALGANWMFLYEAYRQIGVGIATLFCYCGPVLVMILSPLLFKESLTWTKILGFSSVLCGVLLINGQGGTISGNTWGFFCGVMSAVTYAALVIFNKKAKNIAGMSNSMLQLVVSFLTVAVVVGFTRGYAIPIGSSDIVPILVLGLLNTGIGCYLYLSSIGQLPVQTVAICGYLEPLAAVVFSFIFLGETMLPLQILGVVLILGGAAFGECCPIRTGFRFYKRSPQ